MIWELAISATGGSANIFAPQNVEDCILNFMMKCSPPRIQHFLHIHKIVISVQRLKAHSLSGITTKSLSRYPSKDCFIRRDVFILNFGVESIVLNVYFAGICKISSPRYRKKPAYAKINYDRHRPNITSHFHAKSIGINKKRSRFQIGKANEVQHVNRRGIRFICYILNQPKKRISVVKHEYGRLDNDPEGIGMGGSLWLRMFPPEQFRRHHQSDCYRQQPNEIARAMF